MFPGHDKSTFFRQTRRRLHPQSRLERTMGPELDAWSRRGRSAGPCDRGASRLGRLRAGAADGRYVPAAGHFDAGGSHLKPDPRWQADQGGGCRVPFRRHRHGARLLPVVAPDGKCARQCLVAFDLGRTIARNDPGADRSQTRHERQMDHKADRRCDGLARPAAAVDERSP